MINKEKLSQIESGEAFKKVTKAPDNLDLMEVSELLDLRAEIDKRLPATSLSNMNLEQELVLQFFRVKELQSTVLNDTSVAANQQAQVANAVAQTLQHLVTMQSKFHTAERLKEIESRLIKTLNLMPEKHVQEFFLWYEESNDE